jgi:hypothetical protein
VFTSRRIPTFLWVHPSITLPAKVLGTAKDVEVHCTGRVVRKEANGKSAKGKKNKNGVACVIDQYKFIRSKGTK